MRIANVTKGTELADRARLARRPWSRMVGLLGRSALPPGEGLVLVPCASIHTAFMRFPIDVVYADSSRRVVKTVAALRPWRLSGVLRGVRYTVELPAGTIERTGTAMGDELTFQN